MKSSTLYFALLIAAMMFVSSCNTSAPNTNTNTNVNANVASTPNPAAIEADVRRMISELEAAISQNDADALGRLLSDDYRLVTRGGEIQTKEQRLDDIRTGATKFDAFAYEDVTIRTYGDAAVANARINATGKASGRNAGPATATLVFARTRDGWKLVSSQATPASAQPAGTASPANTAARTPVPANTAARTPVPANTARNTSRTNTNGSGNSDRSNTNSNR